MNGQGRAAVVVGVLAATAATLARVTYPAIGRITYRAAAVAETRLRGFHHRTADAAGWRITYYEGGTPGQPAVVLLHGFSGDRDLWVRFAGHLRRDYRLIIPDLAGHGGTGHIPGADYSAPAQARLVVGLMDALGIDRAHVIGNSMGGFVAAHVAAGYPQRTLSLGLCNAAGVTAPRLSAFDRMLDDGRNPFLLSDDDEFDDFYAMTMARPPYLPRIVLDARARDYVDRRDQLAEVFVGHHRRDMLEGALHTMTAPTLIQWGAEDPLIDSSAARVWAAGLPDATVITYDGVGHMPMVEIPHRSAADYAAFLASVNARRHDDAAGSPGT